MQAILFQIICGSIDVSRLIFGPLNEHVCMLGIIMKNLFSINLFIVGLAVTLTKYAYICVYRSPVFDDNFLSAFIHLLTYLLSILACAVKFFGPGAPVLNKVKLETR